MCVGSLHVDATQAELGTLTGLSRQHVNKALHALATLSVLAIERGGIRITDAAGLLDYVGRTGD